MIVSKYYCCTWFTLSDIKLACRREAYTCWPTNSGAEEFNYGTRIDHILIAGPCFHRDENQGDHSFVLCHIKECDILLQFKRWKPGNIPRYIFGIVDWCLVIIWFYIEISCEMILVYLSSWLYCVYYYFLCNCLHVEIYRHMFLFNVLIFLLLPPSNHLVLEHVHVRAWRWHNTLFIDLIRDTV